MDEKDYTITTTDVAAIVIVASAAIFGTYQLGKLGVDWACEGVRFIKSKKSKKG